MLSVVKSGHAIDLQAFLVVSHMHPIPTPNMVHRSESTNLSQYLTSISSHWFEFQ